MSELVVDQVVKDYPTRSEPLHVLRGCSLELARGEGLAILGPSGSGKSTLLQIIGTLDTPTRGTVQVDGIDPFQLAERQLASFRNERIGFVFQDHYLLPQCTVYENVLLPTLAGRGATPDRCGRAKMLLERVGLKDRLEHRPGELSGGERQRAAIARALINHPVLVLADEPTGNLDRSTASGVADLLLELQRDEQSMLVVVTHSLELAARFQRTVELDAGVLIERRPTPAAS
jgi:lipoprotein-releasing system ATP-binding protein